MPGLSRQQVDRLPVVERGERFTIFDAGGGRRVARLFAGVANGKDSSGGWAPVDPSLRKDAKGRFVPIVAGRALSLAASAGDRELECGRGAVTDTRRRKNQKPFLT